MQKELNQHVLRAVVAAVHLPVVSDIEFESSLTELRELAKTLGYQVVGTFVQRRDRFDAAAYLGIGKRQEMRRFVEGDEICGEGDDAHHDADSHYGLVPASELDGAPRVPKGGAAPRGAAKAKAAAKSAANPDTRCADIILVDHEISPSQARNLEIEVG